MDVPIGERFANAIARKDASALRALLAPDVDFRAMTPSRFWESRSPQEVVDEVILGKWFDPGDDILGVDRIEHDEVEGRRRVGYRFRVRNDDGDFVVEQQAYLEEVDGAITWLRIMCAGYQPVAPASA